MDIRCERCATEYEIDEARVPEAGVTIKCSTCGHLFKVRRTAGAPAAKAPEPVSGIELRLLRGGVPVPAGCPDMATLQRWIIERRLLREDEFSQGGAAWRRLGEAPELAPFFELVAAAERAAQSAPQSVSSHAAVTQQMQVPVFGSGTNPMLQPVAAGSSRGQPAPAAPVPQNEAVQTLQFRAPGLSMPAPEAAPATQPDARQTLQFRAAGLSMPAPEVTPDAKQTLQFRTVPPGAAVAAPEAPTDAAQTLQLRTPPASAAFGQPFGAPAEKPAPEAQADGSDTQDTLTFRVPQLPKSAPVATPAAQPVVQPAQPEPVTEQRRVPSPAHTDQFRVPVDASEPPPPSLTSIPTHVPSKAVPTPAPAPAVTLSSERPLPRPEFGEREDEEPARPPPQQRRPEHLPERRAKKVEEPAWASGDSDEEEDPEIAAFKRRGRGGRIAAALVAGVLVVGAAGYFVVWPHVATPVVSDEARSQFDQGRALYLSNVLAKFPKAEEQLQQAITLAGKAAFPEAHGALAELHAAWAERLLDDMAIDAEEATHKTNAGQPEQAQAAAKRAEAARSEAKKQLDLAFTEAKLAFGQEPESLVARRALIDYYRVANDVKKADEQIKKARAQAGQDPETLAHLAAVWAQDPSQLGAAESALGELVQQLPQFVRARYWLAQVHLKRGNQTAALADMEAIVKAAPEHERAKAFLAQAKALAEAAEKKAAEAAAAPQDSAAAEAEPKADPKADPKAAGQKVVEARAEQKGTVQTAAAEPKSVDVDKLISQAVTLIDKGKSAKALDLYDQVLVVKPRNSDALYGRGLALFDLGRTDDSIAAFQKTLDANPRFADAMIGLAEAYKQKGQTVNAVKWYQKYLDTTPNGDQASVAKTNIERLK